MNICISKIIWAWHVGNQENRQKTWPYRTSSTNRKKHSNVFFCHDMHPNKIHTSGHFTLHINHTQKKKKTCRTESESKRKNLTSRKLNKQTFTLRPCKKLYLQNFGGKKNFERKKRENSKLQETGKKVLRRTIWQTTHR